MLFGAAGIAVLAVYIYYLAQEGSNIQESVSNEKATVMQRIKEGLYNVQVNQMDASLIEQQLDKFNVWEEGAEFVHMRGVKIEKFPELLDHLSETYRDSGITLEDRRKWEGAYLAEEWTSKIIEWKFNTEKAGSTGVQGARYGIVAFAKSSDGKSVDCMLTIYKLDFKLAPTLHLNNHAILWGLYKWSTIEKVEIDRSISKDEITRFQNFFRYKALKEFKKEGIIDRIPNTHRLE